LKPNKSFITNTIALILVIAGFTLAEDGKVLLSIGLFALSGALTNLLAVHMLFERVPLLYGSGVIPVRFEAFKEAIKNLMMEQFFTKERLDSFFAKEEQKIELSPIIEETDFNPAYDALTKTVMESPLGGMLGMFGGEKALEGLREPFTAKMKTAIIAITKTEAFNTSLQNHLQNSTLSDDMMKSIESVIDARLNELTPEMVKEMVQHLIKEHLQWLVVWGGVFGGVIGALSSFIL
jgi:uncharacterized membrane protein YheB (UPF0754 family)